MIRSFRGNAPRIHDSAFVEPSASLIGDVEIAEDASVWFNCVLRGDIHSIRIGKRSNIQDLSMVHVVSNKFGTYVGEDVTVGHHVVLHGCTIGDRVLVGMGAIVMDGAVIGSDCIIGAGALVTPGTEVPPGSLVVGSPARVKRALTEQERAFLLDSSKRYVGYAQEHRRELGG